MILLKPRTPRSTDSRAVLRLWGDLRSSALTQLVALLTAVVLVLGSAAPALAAREPSHWAIPASDVYTDNLKDCPGGMQVYDLLKQMRLQQTLITDVSMSALSSAWPRTSILHGFIDKIGAVTWDAVLGETNQDGLGWLLTQNGTPRYIDNPYVNLTRDRGLQSIDAHESYESLLAARVLQSSGNLQPQDILQQALALTNGDYPLATLVAHNLLKEITYARRQGSGSQGRALVAWSQDDRGDQPDADAADWPTYKTLSDVQVQTFIDKLASIRKPGDPFAVGPGADKMGPWYHMFGAMFLGSVTSRPEADFAVDIESFLRHLGLGSDPDPGKEFVGGCGALFGRVALGDAVVDRPICPKPVELPDPGASLGPAPADDELVAAAAQILPEPCPVQPPPAREPTPAPTPTPVPASLPQSKLTNIRLKLNGELVGDQQQLKQKVNTPLKVQAEWDGGPLQGGWWVWITDGGADQPLWKRCDAGATCELTDKKTSPIPGRIYFAELHDPVGNWSHSAIVYVNWVP